MNTLIATLTKNVKMNKDWVNLCNERLVNAEFFAAIYSVEQLEADVREAKYHLEVSKCQLRIAIENEKLSQRRAEKVKRPVRETI